MKKENRQIAQQRRAEQRKKAALVKKIKKIALIAVPTIIICALIISFIVIEIKQQHDSSNSISDTQSTVSSTQIASPDSSTQSLKTASEESTSKDSASSNRTLNKTAGIVIKDGDTVNIDYIGKIDGVAFDGGSTNGAGTDLKIGSNTYIPGFESQLIGHAVGDTVDVNVTFPTDYSQANLAGKDAVFTVTINGVYSN